VAARFELYASGTQWRWRLKSGNGEIIASGEAYTSKAGAQNGIDAVKRDAPDARIEEV
jgi:uncharacterized protein YegP (UPF0339 family)